MTRVLFAVFVSSFVGALLLSAGCAKKTYYTNTFGQYTLSEAHEQFEELFQMKPGQYNQFLSFKDGWWRVDVVKMKEMGLTVPELCKRYCRSENIKVPFPVLIDYRFLRESA